MKYSKPLLSGALLLSSGALSQLTFDYSTKSYICPSPDGIFCASTSLSSPIIITCANGVATPSACTVKLSVAYSACYQSSPSAGNAACTIDGTAYPDNAPPYRHPVPPTSSIGSIPAPTLPPQVLKHFNGTECSCKNGTHPHPPGGPSYPSPPPSSGGGGDSGSPPPHRGGDRPPFPTSLFYPPSPPAPTGTGYSSSGIPHSTSSMKTLASDWKPTPSATKAPPQKGGAAAVGLRVGPVLAVVAAVMFSLL